MGELLLVRRNQGAASLVGKYRLGHRIRDQVLDNNIITILDNAPRKIIFDTQGDRDGILTVIRPLDHLDIFLTFCNGCVVLQHLEFGLALDVVFPPRCKLLRMCPIRDRVFHIKLRTAQSIFKVFILAISLGLEKPLSDAVLWEWGLYLISQCILFADVA